mmetsp:Transcript_105394/g.183307  ORF Transcript_105394/g.183307 Transcript_105394/m.183307 type:complete len:294 (+) Transcript_105394:95-976(+)
MGASHCNRNARTAESDAAEVLCTSHVRCVEGDRIRGDLYGKQESSSSAIFLHGFAGGRTALAHHCRKLCREQDAVAFAPDLTSLTRGGSVREVFVDKSVPSAQERNVRQVVDHVKWLRENPRLQEKPLAIVGHSAGGAIGLEAAVALQDVGAAPAVVVLLDAVPWPRTCDLAARFNLATTKLISIRAEPSVWNKEGAIAEALQRVPRLKEEDGQGQLVDLKVVGAKHGDPMQPSLLLKALGLLGTGEEPMRKLLQAYLSQALGLMPAPPAPAEVLRELQESGKVVDLGKQSSN